MRIKKTKEFSDQTTTEGDREMMNQTEKYIY